MPSTYSKLNLLNVNNFQFDLTNWGIGIDSINNIKKSSGKSGIIALFYELTLYQLDLKASNYEI